MPSKDLAALQRQYQATQDKIRTLGFVIPGTVIERFTVCANTGCHCHADPPTRHGPYLQYSRKIDGKTITRRLTPAQAEDYRQWIANADPRAERFRAGRLRALTVRTWTSPVL